ncbi:PilZ domain-containing protein [Novipirellula artificiosorum]|uniref:Uncharacterized protein n=1 Tax=Novipirellula artificiosorum TaxID=2528016 RepID=A0A5C6DRL8_9BACT|nr:PilZ domain-containing protein [Novipirellula artificiosorum]TWU37399.1 hypothetical protein Poly41_35290 [Novipirellula artificiosorum]
MLDSSYSECLNQWIHSVAWEIELPSEWSDYFDGNGETGVVIAEDERSNQRVGIRRRALLWPELHLPFVERGDVPVGIYTRDFSRSGAGFLSPIEFYPEEEVRIVVPHFWVRVRVTRARRVGETCYETGAVLMQKFEPSADAFGGNVFAEAVRPA